MAKKYISLRGKFSLAPIVSGVVGAMRELGNIPDFTISISADRFEHKESMTGDDTTDLVLYTPNGVEFSGTLEQVDEDNIAYILSGKNIAVPTTTVTDKSLGAVTVGQKIKLDGFNLTAVAVKDGSDAAVAAAKYKVDPVFGTITFLEALPEAKITYTTGAVTHTTIASDFGAEYALFFEGVNKVTGDKVFLQLHRTTKSPDSEFGLIHSGDDIGSYEVSGMALSDLSKDKDGALGLYGYFTTIPKAA